ncbi:MAG: response regulator [Gammaproteobacteria bacterium]|nr:response regulator [Gammaproteobacteria bacterium]
MCREFIFDDYLVASPLHDEFRLRFCVSQAIRLLSIEEKVKETAELSTSWLNDNESNLFANDETEQTTPSQNPLSTRLNQLENNLNSDIKHYSEELKTSKYEKMLSIKDAKSFTPTFNSRLQEIIHNRISTTETEMTNDKRIFFNEYLKNQELRKPALSLLGNEKYIMVIDDNPVSSAELNHFFNEQQFTTYYSTNGKAALSKMLENMPSLIFINNEISGMQSNAIVKMGNILHKDKMPPTIVFTSKATRQNLADIMNQGATSVVSRPFNFDKLLTKITAALSS